MHGAARVFGRVMAIGAASFKNKKQTVLDLKII